MKFIRINSITNQKHVEHFCMTLHNDESLCWNQPWNKADISKTVWLAHCVYLVIASIFGKYRHSDSPWIAKLCYGQLNLGTCDQLRSEQNCQFKYIVRFWVLKHYIKRIYGTGTKSWTHRGSTGIAKNFNPTKNDGAKSFLPACKNSDSWFLSKQPGSILNTLRTTFSVVNRTISYKKIIRLLNGGKFKLRAQCLHLWHWNPYWLGMIWCIW